VVLETPKFRELHHIFVLRQLLVTKLGTLLMDGLPDGLRNLEDQELTVELLTLEAMGRERWTSCLSDTGWLSATSTPVIVEHATTRFTKPVVLSATAAAQVSWRRKYHTTKDPQELSEKQPHWQGDSGGPLYPMTNQETEDEFIAHRSNAAALRRSEADNVPAPSQASQEKTNKESLAKALVAERKKKHGDSSPAGSRRRRLGHRRLDSAKGATEWAHEDLYICSRSGYGSSGVAAPWRRRRRKRHRRRRWKRRRRKRRRRRYKQRRYKRRPGWWNLPRIERGLQKTR
jgi:hypothetical protein